MRKRKRKYSPSVNLQNHLFCSGYSLSHNGNHNQADFSTTIEHWDQMKWHFKEIDEALKMYRIDMDWKFQRGMYLVFTFDILTFTQPQDQNGNIS